MFDEMEIAAGMGYSDVGLLHSPRINLASQLMYYWFHIYAVGGLLDIETGQCMAALQAARSPSTCTSVIGVGRNVNHHL